MGESEIIQYIESGISRGLTLIEVKQSCFARGWSDYDIEKALYDSKIEEKKTEEEIVKKLESKNKEDNSIDGWNNPK